MLVVQGNGAIGRAFVHQMPQMEKRTGQRTRKGGGYMASSGREKMASWTTSKQKSSSAATEFYRGNRSRRERELEWEQKNDQEAGENLLE